MGIDEHNPDSEGSSLHGATCRRSLGSLQTASATGRHAGNSRERVSQL